MLRRVAVVTAVVAVITAGVLWNRGTAPTTNARSLAVLPFVEMSADSADRYFADGLSEEITTALGRINGLRVAARSSAFALRDRAADVRTIASMLGVDAVLEGSVRRSGHQLRVTAQLVEAKTGMNIWAGEYDREAADALTVQDEIARAIAGALELRTPSNGGSARLRRETDLAAYDLYLRALELRNSLRSDALQRATDLLDRAIELQPDFAQAYAAKASVIAPRVLYRQVPREQGLRDMRDAITHAFALDANLGEAHVSLGIVQLFVDWDWAAAERTLRHAIDLDPNNPHAWQHLGNYFRAMNRPAEAAAARLRGLAIDPLNARLRLSLGEDYVFAGRLPDALAALQRGVQLDPLHPIALGLGAPPRGPWDVYLIQGRDSDAVRELLRVATLRGASAGEVDSLRTAFATGGMQGFWRRWLVMDRQQSGASIDPLRVAALSAMAGDTAAALASLERAYSERNMYLIFMRTEPGSQRCASSRDTSASSNRCISREERRATLDYSPPRLFLPPTALQWKAKNPLTKRSPQLRERFVAALLEISTPRRSVQRADVTLDVVHAIVHVELSDLSPSTRDLFLDVELANATRDVGNLGLDVEQLYAALDLAHAAVGVIVAYRSLDALDVLLMAADASIHVNLTRTLPGHGTQVGDRTTLRRDLSTQGTLVATNRGNLAAHGAHLATQRRNLALHRTDPGRGTKRSGPPASFVCPGIDEISPRNELTRPRNCARSQVTSRKPRRSSRHCCAAGVEWTNRAVHRVGDLAIVDVQGAHVVGDSRLEESQRSGALRPLTRPVVGLAVKAVGDHAEAHIAERRLDDALAAAHAQSAPESCRRSWTAFH
jgi:TolB-like protein